MGAMMFDIGVNLTSSQFSAIAMRWFAARAAGVTACC
jgi:hypothetical protein